MLEGDSGSGRHLICQYLSDKFQIPQEDISDNLSYDKIEEITLRVTPYLYIIDSDKLTVKNENVILKFLEEPLKNAYIIILARDKYDLIETIRNRCHILALAKYSKNSLKPFITNPEEENIILTICNTPGQILKMQAFPIKDMLDLCIKIFDKIALASFYNTLTLSDNIAFKSEKDKYDFEVFFKTLLHISKVRAFNNEPNSIQEYMLTRDFYNRSFVRNIDKKMLFENYLLALKNLRSSK
jgi:hypothetical protein